jgi:hypothetical protein
MRTDGAVGELLNEGFRLYRSILIGFATSARYN